MFLTCCTHGNDWDNHWPMISCANTWLSMWQRVRVCAVALSTVGSMSVSLWDEAPGVDCWLTGDGIDTNLQAVYKPLLKHAEKLFRWPYIKETRTFVSFGPVGPCLCKWFCFLFILINGLMPTFNSKKEKEKEKEKKTFPVTILAWMQTLFLFDSETMWSSILR